MDFKHLNEALIREHSDERSFARGVEYYEQGAVDSLVRRGDTLEAEVEGSDIEPYRVTVTSSSTGDIKAACTCPYEWGDWCKHIVAVLLSCIREPERMEEVLPLDTMLAPLDRESLLALIMSLVARNPGLIEQIDTEIARMDALPKSPSQISAPKPAPVPPDMAAVRKLVRAAMKEVGRSSGGYDGWGDYEYESGEEDILEEISPFLENARELARAGDAKSALSLLETVADAVIADWDLVEEIIGDGSEIFTELGESMAEALLMGDFSPSEREEWGERLNSLQSAGDSCGAEDGLEIAVGAAEMGWDYPPLVRVMQGDITENGAWEDESPDYADELAVVRINVLEWQGRLQEAAYVAEAEGQVERHLELLVKLGQAKEAVERAREVMKDAEQTLQLAMVLFSMGEKDLAIELAQYGLGLPGTKDALASWLRDTAIEVGKTEIAIHAAVVALGVQPSLEEYERLQRFSGERWPELRDELLNTLRLSSSYHIAGKVDIFLHEGMMKEALDAASGGWDTALLSRVVEVVTPSLPDEVIPVCRKRAEAIMDAKKADRYSDAAKWLELARTAYLVAGRDQEWKAYRAQLIQAHHKKYKLRPLIEAL